MKIDNNIKSMPNKLLQCVSALAIVAGGSMQANAQVFEDEIIVTATKRAENAQDVGISITALSGDQIEALGFNNAQDITTFTPGVSTVQPNNEGSYSIAIRGSANADFVANQESPVSVYVDEVYISQGAGTGFLLFDTERVEVLRGPQGTLFGRNATGGLAHFITNKPTQEVEGYGKLTIGDFGQFKTEGAISGPLTDTISVRLSGSTNQNSGYIENRFTGDGRDLNNGNDFAGRAQLLWEPSDETSVLLNVRGANQDIRTGGFENVVSVNNEAGFGVLTPGVGTDLFGFVDTDDDVFAGEFDREGFNRLDTLGLSGTIKHRFANGINLTSITDYQTVDRDYIEDSDAGPGDFVNFFVTTDADQFSQEFRLDGETGKFKWVAGVYYLDIGIDDSNGAELGAFAGSGEPEGTLPALVNPYTQDKESISIFGQVDYALNDQITLIGGLRYIQDEVDIDYISNFATVPLNVNARGIDTRTSANVNILDQVASFQGEYDEGLWAGRAQINFQPAGSSSLYYASYNRGVKGGGFNAPFDAAGTLATTGREVLDSDLLEFSEEEVNAFEIGAKLQPLNGVRLNASAYFNDFENYQSFSIAGLDTRVQDSEAESLGFEAELQASLGDGLDVALGVGYNDTDVEIPPILGLDGTTVEIEGFDTVPVQSPEWDLSGLIRKAFDTGHGEFATQVSATYRSEHFFSLNGGREGAGNSSREGGYALVNARISYSPDSIPVEFAGFVDNLFDEEYLVQTFDLTSDFGLTEQIFGRPRWFGASVKYTFGQ